MIDVVREAKQRQDLSVNEPGEGSQHLKLYHKLDGMIIKKPESKTKPQTDILLKYIFYLLPIVEKIS